MPRPLSGVEESPTSRQRPQLRQGRSGRTCAARQASPPESISIRSVVTEGCGDKWARGFRTLVRNADSTLTAKVFCLEPILNGIPPSRHHSIRKKYNFAGSFLTLYLECGSAPRRGLRRIEKAAALLLLAKGANRGFTRSICPGA